MVSMMGSKGTVLILLLIIGSMIAILPNIKPVKAINPAIAIKPDGSIEGTDKIQRNGDFYYLTDNIEFSSIARGLSVQRDNITIDGKGFGIIQKDARSSYGVVLSERFNVTIQNLKITGFSLGIDLIKEGNEYRSASNNTIIGNTITSNNEDGFQVGIWIGISSGNKIINNTVTGFNEYGILFHLSDNNYISGNVVTGNNVGFSLNFGCNNNVLRNNQIYDNEENFEIRFNYPSGFIQDIDTSNTVNGKPIYYWIYQHNKTIPSQAGFVALANCSGIMIQNLEISNNGNGIILYSTRDSQIKNNHFEDNGNAIEIRSCESINVTGNKIINSFYSGIRMAESTNISILENDIVNNAYGITLSGYNKQHAGYGGSNNILILNNNFTGNNPGIDLSRSQDNVISSNIFTANILGISAIGCCENLIVGNSFVDNDGYAIRWSGAYNNTFYYNNFINNKAEGLQVSNPWLLISGGAYEGNTWDNDVEGNYWSDYTSRYSNATEVDGSGIWDVPFFINEVNIDRFPLTEPVDIEVARVLLLYPPDICVSSPENMTYITDSVSLNFTVNEATSWMGYSLDGQNNVTITENTLNLTELSKGSHSLTVYANDTSGDMGKSETIYFTIGTSLITWVIGAIVIVAVVGAAFLAYFLKIKKATKPE